MGIPHWLPPKPKTRPATITFDTAENDNGHEVDCVFATCEETGCEVGPIWGQHERSVKRALMTLTERCSCGAGFHFESEGDDGL